MMKRIVLFGGGLHVGYCIDIILQEGKFEIVGIIDSIGEIGSSLYGFEIIGRQDDLIPLISDKNIEAGVITIGDNYSRKQVFDDIMRQVPDFEFVNAIHPSVIVGSGVEIGIGVVVMAGCIINPYSKVSNFCFLATGAQVEHDCLIKDFASLSAGCVLGGKVTIGPYSALTLGVIVMDRLSIGENTVVGSGSLVTKNLPDNVLAYGNPAKIIRERGLGEKFLKSN